MIHDPQYHEQPTMATRDEIERSANPLRILAWTCGVLVLGMVAITAIVAIVMFIAVAESVRSRLPEHSASVRTLEPELGFTYGTPYLDSSLWDEVFTIESVEPGGVFDRAGFLPNDIILDDLSVFEFFDMLEEARGGEPVTITVVDWNDPRPLDQRPRRRLRVSVPASQTSSQTDPVP